MKRIFCVIFMLMGVFGILNATHNRAGEITYEQVSGYTFKFTITTFTYSLSAVEVAGGRAELNVSWGDNTTSIAKRKDPRIKLPGNYYHNQYFVNHTFPGPGTYEIVMQDPNRNFGVLNIPNSVNVVFSVKTTMIINPQLGSNNTPVLLNNPIDKAALGMKFIHNPAAYDYDGDSLSYKLTTCLRDQGKPIENYSLPRMEPATPEHPKDTIYVNPLSGDLVWQSPRDTGIFNLAMNIEEWRKGVKIGNIVRDMQVEVHQSVNTPPVNPYIKDICVVAGALINQEITATDREDSIQMSSSGGPYVVDQQKATFTRLKAGKGYTTSVFSWQTDVSLVRKQPYEVIVKSEDNNPSLKLVDISNFNIHIVAPAPENLRVFPGNNSNLVKWSKTVCPAAIGYNIYRSTSPEKITPDTCNGGIPAGTGYILAGSVSINDTIFTDTDNSKGLLAGATYCYRVTAFFKDGAESLPSAESCTTLVPGAPALITTSVVIIDPAKGEVFLSWIKPRVDTIPAASGPFEYLIYRAGPGIQNNFSLIKTLPSIDLSDTSYLDTALNTLSFPYTYKVEFYNNTPGNRFLLGHAELATTLYPDLAASDKKVLISFVRSVPWQNLLYVIYRKNNTTAAFDSIGFTDNEIFEDDGLVNGFTYTYRVKAYGRRNISGKDYSTLNWSHVNSTSPKDTIPPCAPFLRVTSDCDNGFNRLSWNNNNIDCAKDVVKYNIYYMVQPTDKPVLVTSMPANADSTFRHTPPVSLGGCYEITAVDSFNNESPLTNATCVDICLGYSLPNVFTPNGDNIDDIYHSFNPGENVKKVEMKIFNRWGKIVFETTDPDINWDGRDMNTHQFVSTGVYYYICDVYIPRRTLGTTVINNLLGFIHVFHGDGTPQLTK